MWNWWSWWAAWWMPWLRPRPQSMRLYIIDRDGTRRSICLERARVVGDAS